MRNDERKGPVTHEQNGLRLAGTGPAIRNADAVWSQAGPAYESALGDYSQEPGAIPAIVDVLHRRKWLILFAGILFAAAGYFWALSTRPVYTVAACIEVRTPRPSQFDDQYVALDSSIEAQVRMLRSRPMISQAVARMLERGPDGFQADASPPQKLLSRFGLRWPGEADLTFEEVLRHASRTVRVGASDNGMIDLTCSSLDTKVAGDFLDTLIDEFTEKTTAARWNSQKETGEFLARRTEELRQNLEKSERALQQYLRSSGLGAAPDATSVDDVRLTNLQQELSRAQAERVARQTKHQMAMRADISALPEVVNDPLLRTYQAQLSDLRRQITDLTTTYTASHPNVRRLAAQAEQLESQMRQERATIVSRLGAEHLEAVRKEEELQAAYDRQSGVVTGRHRRSISYDMLKREAEANRHIYESMLQRTKETVTKTAVQPATVRLIEPPLPTGGKKNDPVRYAILGFFAGAVLIVGAFTARELLDGSMKAPGDGPQCLRVPELGVIPSASVDAEPEYSGTTFLRIIGRVSSAAEATVELVTWHRKPSLIAEAFRATLVSMLFAGPGSERRRVFLITSAGPGEGKSTVVSNLAAALADVHGRVLVIDADMRNPRMHKIFDQPNTWGLSDVLRENSLIESIPLEALVRRTSISGVSLLPSGPAVPDTMALLLSPRTAVLLERLRQEFGIILIDTPPILQFTDARILGRLADRTILVLRARKVKRADAVAALQRLAEDGVQLHGTILNDWNPTFAGQKHYRSYYRYYA
jgi:capsular exopolysaccharide synthesis family protein